MKKIKKIMHFGVCTLPVILAMLVSGVVLARDDAKNYSIAEAMQTATAKSFTGVAFYFGDQSHPAVKQSIGSYTSKKATNAFNKSEYDACQWAFLSAIKSFYERALSVGGNAVINIQSITTGRTVSSVSEFICRAGNVVAKVYLKADVVIL